MSPMQVLVFGGAVLRYVDAFGTIKSDAPIDICVGMPRCATLSVFASFSQISKSDFHLCFSSNSEFYAPIMKQIIRTHETTELRHN